LKKRLFVTDPSGCVGQHIRSRLASSGWSWDLLPAASTCELIHSLSHTNLWSPLPDAVIQLAGQPLASEAFRDPARTPEINLLGTLTLLQRPKTRGRAGTFLPASSADACVQNGSYLANSKSTFIAAGHKHRQENSHVIGVSSIGIRGGEYRGEDNVVRFKKPYSRTT
jgi:nucleoside-diphosphate-sugar epimerase